MGLNNLLKKLGNNTQETTLDPNEINQLRILNFLDENRIGNPDVDIHVSQEDPLHDLFEWGKYLYRRNRELERGGTTARGSIQGDHFVGRQESKPKQTKERQNTEGYIQQLKRSLMALEVRNGRLVAEKQDLTMQLSEKKVDYKKEVKARQEGEEIAAVLEESLKEVSRERDDQKLQIQDLERAHASEIRRHKKESTNKLNRREKDHNVAMDKIREQMLFNQKDDQAWSVGKIKFKIEALQRLIEEVTTPHNKSFSLPSNQNPPSYLDTTSFVARAGQGEFHFLLKHAIWEIIKEQFFSAPFGFGALGPGGSQKSLFQAFYSWNQLFENNGASDTLHENFEMFKSNEAANDWRSATFQCIIATVTSERDSYESPPVFQFSRKNSNHAVKRILKILSDVANLSKNAVEQDVQNRIHKIVCLAEEIGLQFGVNSACLKLVIPSHKQMIEIGDEFQHCRNGDSDRGDKYIVDLVTSAGVQKIGDGKLDFTSVSTVVPCEIYPLGKG